MFSPFEFDSGLVTNISFSASQMARYCHTVCHSVYGWSTWAHPSPSILETMFHSLRESHRGTNTHGQVKLSVVEISLLPGLIESHLSCNSYAELSSMGVVLSAN